MDEIEVVNGDIVLRVEVAGEGPVILCVHGWPELSYSWRHQLRYFSEHGYRIAAMDVRGYGGSSAPAAVERYTLKELASDVAAVATALSEDPVILFGHDWGAPIAYHTAIRHPDVVRAVAGLSVPFTPPMPVSLLDLFDQLYPGKFFYMLHFQEPGLAEAEFGADLSLALKTVYHAISGEGDPGALAGNAPRGAPMISNMPPPPDGPLSFLGDDDLAVYVAAFERSGLTGAFNRYRALALEPEASADIVGATLDQPSCFIGGELDAVRSMVPGSDVFADPGAGCTDFRGSTIIDGAGHWVQQEAPAEVNAALHSFVSGL